MKISTRIKTTAFVAVALVLAITLWIALSISNVREQYTEVSNNAIPFIEGVEDLRFYGTRALTSAIEIAFIQVSQSGDARQRKQSRAT